MNIEYRENTLTAEQYLMMEQQMGDPLTTIEQAERSIAHQLYSITALKDGQIVGIARLLGDAAIYWYINDVWVLPEYQGKGIGSNMVKRLIQYVKEASVPGTSVSLCLMSAKDKEGFYEKLGFFKRPCEWEGAGMEMEIDTYESCRKSSGVL